MRHRDADIQREAKGERGRGDKQEKVERQLREHRLTQEQRKRQ